MRNLNGQLEFFDVDKLETMASDEHFMASSVAWDPTGRFVVTVVSAWRQQLETVRWANASFTFMFLFSTGHEFVHVSRRKSAFRAARPVLPTVVASATANTVVQRERTTHWQQFGCNFSFWRQKFFFRAKKCCLLLVDLHCVDSWFGCCWSERSAVGRSHRARTSAARICRTRARSPRGLRRRNCQTYCRLWFWSRWYVE